LTTDHEEDKTTEEACFEYCKSDETCNYFYYGADDDKCFKFADLNLCAHGDEAPGYNIYYIAKFGYTEIHNEKKCDVNGQAVHTTTTVELCQAECWGLVHCA